MLLDVSVPFGEQYSKGYEYRQALLSIQTHQVDRGAATTWANNLRFLTIDTENQPPSDNELAQSHESIRDYDANISGCELSISDSNDLEPLCSCASHDAAYFEKDVRRLRITEPSDLPSCTHYVALSYCWQSTNRARNLGANSVYTINTRNGMRHNNVSSDVLDRAIAFARPRKRAYIWIDQECIKQDDERDQAEGIQAMDLVYQQAEYCLGILDVHIADQKHIDALNTMLDGEGITEGQLVALAEVLELILSDPWFTRAWILQESLAGAAQMTLQMKCDPLIVKGPLLEPMFSISSEYLEIELAQLHAYLSTWLPTTVEDMAATSAIGPATASRCTNVIEKWFGMLPPQAPVEWQPDRRLACSAAAAVSYLKRRKNTVIADRIAIMANLCGYHKRLDSSKLDRLGFKFSLCAFVLSIMNGDMSLLQGCVHPLQNVSGRVDNLERQSCDFAHKTIGFTWSLPEWATLNSLVYMEIELTDPILQLKPSILTESGWLLDGWLWYIDHAIDLKPVKTRLAGRWDFSELKKLTTPTRSSQTFLVDVMLELLCFLVETGYVGMATLFWDLLRRRPTERNIRDIPEAGPYSEASLEQVIDVETRQIVWLNPIPSVPSHFHRSDPFQGLYDSRRDVGRILQAVIFDEFLPVGRLEDSKSTRDAYQALFDRATVGKLYFAPAEYCKGSTKAREFYRWQPRAFQVSRTFRRSPENHEIFACHGLDMGGWSLDPGRISHVCLE